MITSILDYVVEAKPQTGSELKALLHGINCTVFDEVFAGFPDMEAKYTIMYILYAYSQDSNYLIMGAAYEREKKGICELLDMPEYLADRLVNLVDNAVRECILSYLEEYSNAEWKNLQFLKMQYSAFQRSITNKEIKDENFQHDVKGSIAATRALEGLSKQIERIESTIRQRYKHMEANKDDVNKAKAKSQNVARNASVESSPYIVRKGGTA